MRKQMSICVNGQTRVPPGFRFHPTEEELLQYYLKKRVGNEEIDLDVICEVDLNKLEPWDIQEKCKIGTSLQSEWYIFSHKDKKYPTGTRTNRATTAGFWKATGRDKVIYNKKGERIGMRKTLVFYKGRAPHGQKSDWIMHEYRLLDDHHSNYDAPFNDPTISTISGESIQEEAGWVVCRIFKKKPHPIATANTRLSSSTATTDTPITTLNSPLCNNAEGALNQIFRYMGATDAHRVMVAPVNGKNFMKLPRLGSPLKESAYYTPCFDNSADENDVVGVNTSHVEHDPVYDTETGFLSGVGWFMDNNADSIFSTTAIHESQHQMRSTSSSWPAGENELEIMVKGGIK